MAVTVIGIIIYLAALVFALILVGAHNIDKNEDERLEEDIYEFDTWQKNKDKKKA